VTLTAQDVARAQREENERAARAPARAEGKSDLNKWLRERGYVAERQQEVPERDAATGQFRSGGGLDQGGRGSPAPAESDKEQEARHINDWLHRRGRTEIGEDQ
jgi:hypothetical protein